MKNKVIIPKDLKTLQFRENSCVRKRRFNSHVEAEMLSRFEQYVYHCCFCDGYHLASRKNYFEQKERHSS